MREMVSWSKKGKPDDPAEEFDVNQPNAPIMLADQLKTRSTMIRKMNLTSVNDIQKIKGEIEEGNMAIIDVAGFVTSGEFTILELKRAIEQIRSTCAALGGALARLGDRYLLATPNERLQLAI